MSSNLALDVARRFHSVLPDRDEIFQRHLLEARRLVPYALSLGDFTRGFRALTRRFRLMSVTDPGSAQSPTSYPWYSRSGDRTNVNNCYFKSKEECQRIRSRTS
jgi:hypothetical protein